MPSKYLCLRNLLRGALPFFCLPFLTGCITVDVSESKVFLPYGKLSQEAKGNLAVRDAVSLNSMNIAQDHFSRPAHFGTIAMSRMSHQNNAEKPIILACMGTTADRYRSGVYYTKKSIDYGDVILFDYPGYNESDGTATTANFIEASHVVASYLKELRTQTHRPILAAGHSLGGFVCAGMIDQNPGLFEGIIIETSAQNIDQIVKARTPAIIGFLLKPRVAASLRQFDIAESLKGFDGPVLLMGAGQDKELKVELTHKLHDALLEQGNDVDLQIFEVSGHENIYTHPNYSNVMRAFYRRF